MAARGEDVTRTRPACYGGVGFTPALRAAGADGQVVLVDLDRLYRGDWPGGSGERTLPRAPGGSGTCCIAWSETS